MAAKLNRKGETKARGLIRRGKVRRPARWNPPGTTAENRFIEDNSLQAFGLWHLGMDPEINKDTKGHFKFIYTSDFKNVDERGLIAIRQRAGQTKREDIFEAAGRLLEQLRGDEEEAQSFHKKDHKPKRRRVQYSGEAPDTFELTASLDFQAQEKEDSRPKFVIIGNTGKPMELNGFFHPLVIDIAGATFDKKTTAVIADHDVSSRIGHTVEQVVIPAGGTAKLNGKTVRGPLIAAAGIISSGMGVALGFAEDAKRGFPFQASIGANADKEKLELIQEGEKVEVNGKTFKGPLIVSRKTVIRELTITVLGADNQTSSKLAAQAKTLIKGIETMDFEAFVKSLHLDPEKLTEEQRTALTSNWHKQKGTPDPTPTPAPAPTPNPAPSKESEIEAKRKQDAQEEKRQTSIRAVVSRFDGLEKVKIGDKDFSLEDAKIKAFEAGWSADELELHCRRSEYPIPSAGPAIHSTDKNLESEALQAAILRQHGVPNKGKNKTNDKEFGLESMFKSEVLEASHQKQYRYVGSIHELLDLQIRASGKSYSGSKKGPEFVKAAVESWEVIRSAGGLSTLNIPDVLENVMNKAALASFDAVESVWPFIARMKALNDFKAHALYRLDYEGHYKQVAQDGELKHISMEDTKFTVKADTFGAMVSIDRKTIRNDDLGMVVDQARGLGMLGAQRIEESVLVLLLSNPAAFFSAGNGNLITGATSALSVEGIERGRQAFRDQIINGKPVGISPRILLVGTTNETTAARLFSEERLDVGGAEPSTSIIFVNNPFVGMFRPVVSGYLNNTSITDQDGLGISGQSATQWYLFADPTAPQGGAICIGFLDGRQTPFFDEAETQFNIPGGIMMRSYLDWGVAMHVTQMAVKSNGV